MPPNERRGCGGAAENARTRRVAAMKKHMDEEKLRIAREAANRIPDLLAIGDEELFVKTVKEWKPDIGPEKLRELINAFRAALAEKRGLRR